jgi:poly(3-hydroxybutyrate) depolymerase
VRPLIAAVVASCAVVIGAAVLAGEAPAAALSFPPNQAVPVPYLAWNGTPRQAVVLLPASHQPGDPALPCVIAAHGRDMPPAVVAQRWGELPTMLGLAVICADSAGIREPYNSWAAPGQVRDLMRLPALVERAVSGLRFDHDRIFAAGVSMGGQEVLCMAARYPDRLAGVASFDGVTDLSARYREVLHSARGGAGVRKRMRNEMGGTPGQAPFSYRLRSPQAYTATLATSGVPVQLWWSPRDVRVINQATTQTGALYRRIRAHGAAPQVTEVVTDMAHGVAFCAAKGFEQMLAGFRPDGEWLTAAAAPPQDWTYVGCLREARFWQWQVRLVRPPSTPWRLTLHGSGIVDVHSAVRLRLTAPCLGPARPVRVLINGRVLKLTSSGETVTIAVPAGDTTVVIDAAETSG